ncbi:MAG: thiamine pyrophosphate-binding protein [Deltaproteobacteria bacterium]|nr:thiamine pyrophosphate-binding protein [Deltaproteobacteria bacterium]
MEAITGGELLARCLAAEGVRFVFGLPSPEIDPLLPCLATHGIRLVPIRHEAAGVHMAEGLYKSTGQVAAVIGNPGPGSANLLPGLITARHEGVPVLALTSQHRLGIVYPSTPATFQGQDQLDVFRPIVKWGGPALSWERIPEVLRLAFREMWTGRPGPVQVELPAPVLYATGDPATAPVLAPGAYRPPQPQASEQQLAAAADLLASAKRPLVVAGSGVDRAGANAALLELVELLGCPLLPTMAARSVAPADHPNAVMGYSPAGDAARREADVILVAGSRLGNLDLPFDKYWGDPGGQRLIQIDLDPRNMGVTRPLALGIVADVADALPGLLRVLRARGLRPRDAARAHELHAATEAWKLEQAGSVLAWSGAGIHPAHAIGTIGAAFGRDAIYVADGGNTSLWASAVLPPTRPRSYLSILELGMLGTGIPQAIGAKLGAPEREVVCITGDGAAGFNVMELQSAAREGLEVTVVVCAEGSWTMEIPNERALYGKTFGTDMGLVRWDRVAEGLGAHGEHVEKIDELPAALERARRVRGPRLLCVRTDREANLAVPDEMMKRFFEVYAGATP